MTLSFPSHWSNLDIVTALNRAGLLVWVWVSRSAVEVDDCREARELKIKLENL